MGVKALAVLSALLNGQEVSIHGKTYVWLNNKVIEETDTHQKTINGLAIKGKTFKSGQDIRDWSSGEDTYLGVGNMPINTFITMCEVLSDEEFVRITNHLVEKKIGRIEHSGI